MKENISKDEIKQLAIAHGFKLKKQESGNLDLNDYVYRFALSIYNTGWLDGHENGVSFDND